MKTALIFHGPQGTGKNLFFEAVMAIYADYGRIVDQTAIEEKFNDWASKKLFLIADEVVARAELYHVKNKLKHFITGDWIRINPKNVNAYDERNHVNLVFLSNETQPLVLERDDRRFTVVWTPPNLPDRFYTDVKAEIIAGGVAALHDHLLNLELGDFRPWTKPPMTASKAELIELGMDSTERFWNTWAAGELDPVPFGPVRSQSLFDFYKSWCTRVGIPRYAPLHVLLANLKKRTGSSSKQARYMNGHTEEMKTFLFPPAHQVPPAGKTQGQWLSDAVEAFETGLGQWRDDDCGRR
jgi:putative DNA primase/helicase